jgi:hypothetical protein
VASIPGARCRMPAGLRAKVSESSSMTFDNRPAARGLLSAAVDETILALRAYATTGSTAEFDELRGPISGRSSEALADEAADEHEGPVVVHAARQLLDGDVANIEKPAHLVGRETGHRDNLSVEPQMDAVGLDSHHAVDLGPAAYPGPDPNPR